MANPAVPTKLKLLRGNPGKHPLPKHEPQPRPILPDPPPYLGKVARQRWDELLPELDVCGVLTRIDGDILAGYCVAYEEICLLTRVLHNRGRTYKVGTNGALSARPEVAMLNRAKDDLRKFGAELGIGAAARTKVETRTPDAGKTPLEAVREATQRR